MFQTRMKIALSALLLSAAACSTNTDADMGRVSLRLTDAAGDIVKAVVTIDRIYMQPGEEDDAGRVTLRDEDVTLDLVTLANETANLVDEAVLPAGTYSQLRFVISGAYIEVENEDGSTSVYATSPTYAGLPAGETVDGELRTPSFATSGLKVNLPGGALQVSGDTEILLVDFDVSQSFGHAAGNSGAWVMHPVVNAAEITTAAGVTVTLAKPAALTLPTGVAMTDFRAVLENAEGSKEELAFSDANGDGVFEAAFQFVLPGDYSVNLAAPTGVTFTTTETRPTAVTLASGGSATVSFNLATVTR